MFSSSQCSYFVILLVLITCGMSSADNVNISVPLNKTLSARNKELYGDFVTIDSNSTFQVTLTNINKNVAYIIFQVHSHLYNVTLYNNTLTKNSAVSGTNLGLYGTVKPPDTYYILNNHEKKLKLYISIHGYRSSDPIPGGCNMESSIYIAPFTQVTYTKDIITVEAPAPQLPKDINCMNGINTPTQFYRMYLTERDFSEESYFNGIKSMITYDKIQENGALVPKTTTYGFLRRFLSSYPGTGSVYVAVVGNDDINSVYVPSYTYGCSPIDGCNKIDDVISHFFCAGLLFLGIFICFLGHRFFKTEMFLVGMFAGVIVTYMLIPMWTDLAVPALLGASVMSGIFFGAIWLLFWWFYGIPLMSVLLWTMQLGFLIAAITYNNIPDGHPILENDGAFWSIFIVLMLLTSITMTTMTYMANLVCCAILGAYATVFALDHYIGSNLKYIVINTVRRAVVPDFNKAVLAMPFQWKDAMATLAWVVLATSGLVFHHYHNRGRPPFPPPPRSIATRISEPMTYGAVANRGRRYYRGVENGIDTASTLTNERSPLID